MVGKNNVKYPLQTLPNAENFSDCLDIFSDDFHDTTVGAQRGLDFVYENLEMEKVIPRHEQLD